MMTPEEIWKRLKAWNWLGIGVRIAVISVIVFTAVVIRDHYQSEGEPFSLFAGVSIWPGEALRLIATILSVCFIVKSLKDLQDKDEKLCKRFNLKNAGEYRNSAAIPCKQWWSQLAARGPWRYLRERVSIHSWEIERNETINADQLWKQYLVRATWGKRFCRLLPMSLAYFFLALILMFTLGIPKTPCRGSVALWLDRTLLLLSVSSMIILIFFVVDATKLSLRFIRNLKVPKTRWPGKSDSGSGEDSDKPGPLAEWRDIRFIASHTEEVGKLIYYPFIILLIMFVARTSHFDNWGFPISLVIVFLLNSTCALCCGGMLRIEAEKTRSIALERLRDRLIKAKVSSSKHNIEQIEAMIEQIRSIRKGTYSPFTENPLLHAILIPSGGMSLLTLLRFFPL